MFDDMMAEYDIIRRAYAKRLPCRTIPEITNDTFGTGVRAGILRAMTGWIYSYDAREPTRREVTQSRSVTAPYLQSIFRTTGNLIASYERKGPYMGCAQLGERHAGAIPLPRIKIAQPFFVGKIHITDVSAIDAYADAHPRIAGMAYKSNKRLKPRVARDTPITALESA